MFKKFKSFYNKHDCNYSEGLVDPFEFHKTFYKFLVLFKVADILNKQKALWFNQNTFIFATGTIATVMVFISMCHGIQIFEIPHMTETGTYGILLFYKLLIQSSIKLNLPQYHNLLRHMKEDFYYICTKGKRYRNKFFKNQLVTWKLCIILCIFNACVGVGIVFATFILLCFYLVTHKPGDVGSRPLLFPFWLPGVDFGNTPYYEIAFVFSDVCVLSYAYNYTFMLQTHTVWIRQITSKVDIVIWSIQDLLEGVHPTTNAEESKYFSALLETRMREIVIHHQAMLRLIADYVLVYKKMLMYEQKLCAPVTCLTAYSVVTKMEEEGVIDPVLPILCIATTVLHFISSYSCNFLADKVSSISDACWSIPFWNAGPVIRPYMVLIMQRAQRPLPLHAPGFESISLETFSKKMTSAYSFFNMLRQTDIK